MNPERLLSDCGLHPLGIGTGQKILLVLLSGIAIGSILTFAPLIATSAVAGLTVLLLLAYPLRHYRVFLLLSVILLVPADHLTALLGPPRGLFALGAAGFVMLTLVIQGRLPRLYWRDYDVYLVIATLCVSVLQAADPTQGRIVIFWITGVLLLGILNRHLGPQRVLRGQVVAAVLCAGVTSSLVAWVQHLGQLPGWLLTYYEPRGVEGGLVRAFGLSGHPLRLGTLTMLATFLGTYTLVNSSLTMGRRVMIAGMTILCFSTLVLSGARGAWLGLLVSVLACVASSIRRSRRVAFRIVCATCAGLFLLSVTGLGEFVIERTLGGAAAPRSIAQRVEAARVVSVAWLDAPFTGVGPGGVEGTLYSGGLVLPNIENEYLITLLSAGLCGLLSLLFLVGRRLRLAWQMTDPHWRVVVFPSLAGMFTNMGTYNYLAWSAGATLIVSLLWLVWPDEPAEPSLTCASAAGNPIGEPLRGRP